jgi:hypothetical protein
VVKWDVVSHSGRDRDFSVVVNDKGMRGVGQVAGKEVNIVLTINIIPPRCCSALSWFIVRFDIAGFVCW